MSKKKKTDSRSAPNTAPKKAKNKGVFNKSIDSIKAYWDQKSPVLKFLLGFAGCMILFYLIYLSPIFVENIGKPILKAQAAISSGLLNLLGQGTSSIDDVIVGKDFSISIKNGCDGLETLAIMLNGIVVFPIAFRLKWPGLLYGTIALMLLNFVRIIALYLVGKNFSQGVFDILHEQGGFVIFTVLGVFLWIIWANWALKKSKTEPLQSTAA